jgi:amidohydrolase
MAEVEGPIANGIESKASANGVVGIDNAAVDVEELKRIAACAVDSAAKDLTELSREIWRNPELYYQERKAHRLLTDFLEQRGFVVERSYKLETAFRATAQQREGFDGNDGTTKLPRIAFLCEYDALPGIGHACGHNLIAEVGVGAGLGVKAALDAAGVCLGQLIVLGTPAEEEGGGKIDLINAGAFQNIDVAMMSHPGTEAKVDVFFAALQEVKVRFYGKSSHAAMHPWEGINALDAAVMAYSNISCLRQQMHDNCRIHGIITKGGVTPNVIPDEAELFYYIRAPKEVQLRRLVGKVKACFEAAAVATGCKVEYHWDPHTYQELITNRSLAQMYEKNARSLGVVLKQDSTVTMPTSGSSDMGNVSHVVPAIHPHFYIGPDPEHTLEFTALAGSDEAQISALCEAKILAFTAIDILCQPGLLERIRHDFEKDQQLIKTAAKNLISKNHAMPHP